MMSTYFGLHCTVCAVTALLTACSAREYHKCNKYWWCEDTYDLHPCKFSPSTTAILLHVVGHNQKRRL